MNDDEAWFNEDPGPLVRPFAVTRGRAGDSNHNLDIITLVVGIRPEPEPGTMQYEYAEIIRVCQNRPQSIAEIAAHLNLLVAAVKVLVGDLIDAGHLIHRSPPAPSGGADVNFLQAVLDGLRRI